jgi:diadenosine tetraphosphate (Ap4A) HIT family hydrolase
VWALLTAMSEPGWSLHPQLDNDTAPVGDLTLSRVLAINDADYPWLILVPRRTGVIEIIDLGVDAPRLMEEILLVSRTLKDVTGCDKLNVAALGNVVPQLHVHIIARRTSDPAWPNPVWGKNPPCPYEAGALARFTVALRKLLRIP